MSIVMRDGSRKFVHMGVYCRQKVGECSGGGGGGGREGGEEKSTNKSGRDGRGHYRIYVWATPLLVALTNEHYDCARLLLKLRSADPHFVQPVGMRNALDIVERKLDRITKTSTYRRERLEKRGAAAEVVRKLRKLRLILLKKGVLPQIRRHKFVTLEIPSRPPSSSYVSVSRGGGGLREQERRHATDNTRKILVPWRKKQNRCSYCRKELATSLMGVLSAHTTSRAHHCRLCGRVLCNACSSKRRVLPMVPYRGTGSKRVCDRCATIELSNDEPHVF